MRPRSGATALHFLVAGAPRLAHSPGTAILFAPRLQRIIVHTRASGLLAVRTMHTSRVTQVETCGGPTSGISNHPPIPFPIPRWQPLYFYLLGPLVHSRSKESRM